MYSYAGKDIVILPTNIIVYAVRSHVAGFWVTTGEAAYLKNHYATTPFTVSAEHVEIQEFNVPPNAGGLNCTMSRGLNNIKELCLLYRENATDNTCFGNPGYDDVTLLLPTIRFPDRGADTTSDEFYRSQQDAAHLDTVLQSTESFEASYTGKIITDFPYRKRAKEDDTSFVHIIPCERASANAFFFDGINMPENTSILLTGHSKFGGMRDTYYILNRHNNQLPLIYNISTPMLCMISDSFWLFTSTGDGVYDRTSSWNQTFLKHHPALYTEMYNAMKNQYNYHDYE
jgi:hypothetical protein